MTSEVFWQTIADYNRVTWPVQALLIAAGALLTRRLYRAADAGNEGGDETLSGAAERLDRRGVLPRRLRRAGLTTA